MKAIDTEYKGYLFRSRQEARVAVLLDGLNAEWDYETEGYDINGVRYLPDFVVHNVDCRDGKGLRDLFIEVKGHRANLTDYEEIKINQLSNNPDIPIVVFNFIPNFSNAVRKGHEVDYLRDILTDLRKENKLFFSWKTINPERNGKVLFGVDNSNHFVLFGKQDLRDDSINFELTRKAYETARKARFEFGQTPEIERLPYIKPKDNKELIEREFDKLKFNISLTYRYLEHLINEEDINLENVSMYMINRASNSLELLVQSINNIVSADIYKSLNLAAEPEHGDDEMVIVLPENEWRLIVDGMLNWASILSDISKNIKDEDSLKAIFKEEDASEEIIKKEVKKINWLAYKLLNTIEDIDDPLEEWEIENDKND